MKLFFGILLLQGIVQKQIFFLKIDFWQCIFFYETVSENIFYSSEIPSFCRQNKAYHGQIPPPKIYKVKPVFNHLVRKFSEGYVLEDQLSLDKSLPLWKGGLV
jgi:hypothetical protein